jgi:hypothetical protein
LKQDNTRYIVLKTIVNEQENETIRRNCAANGKTVSAAARELLLQASAPAHRIRRSGRREGPRVGPALNEIFPARRGGAPVPLRL